MAKPPKKDSEAQIAKRRDTALMRALSMPHKPHKGATGKSSKKKAAK